MSKTIKQIVDEYNARTKKPVKLLVGFIRERGYDAYSNVVNLYRDGIKVETVDLDSESHKYEFDNGFDPLDGSGLIWTHYGFNGQVTEYHYEIKE